MLGPGCTADSDEEGERSNAVIARDYNEIIEIESPTDLSSAGVEGPSPFECDQATNAMELALWKERYPDKFAKDCEFELFRERYQQHEVRYEDFYRFIIHK